MSTQYNLSEIFRTAFGINTPIFLPNTTKKPPKNIHFTGFTLADEEEVDRRSCLGTPIVYPFTFKGGKYKRYKTNGDIEIVSKENYLLPAATLVDFSRPKNITKTNVLGGEGTVKEIYGFDDWKINIKGVCLSEPNKKAQDQINELLQWENLIDAIAVSGSLFSNKGINALVIEDIQIQQVQGKPGVVPFTITAVSDMILELEYDSSTDL